jgi:serine phosphatase RsbU (regulator of sigma subunit)
MAQASPSTTPARFLSGEVSKDRRSVEVLLEAIARVSESRDIEALLEYVVDRSVEVTGAERGLLVLQGEGGSQVVRVARQNSSSLSPEEVKYSTTVVRRVLDEDVPQRTTVHSDAEALELGTSVFDLKLRAVMCVPLSPQEPEDGGLAARGVLYVDSKAATRAFTDEDLSLFFALARHIAIALENAHLNLQSLEKVRLEQSLVIASQIQSGLMPKEPLTIPGFDVHGWYDSADHASGDFFDFVRTRDGRLAVVLGDVAGHGIGPALITATAQASLRSYVRVLGDPAAIVSMLSEDLAGRMDDGMFLTLFLALLRSDGSVHVLNAGHPPPLVWRHAQGRIESIPGTGPAIGMMNDFPYAEGPRLVLAEGDLLLALSDGVLEARHADGERLFGEEGVNKVLSQTGRASASAREVVEALVKSVAEFSGGAPQDDQTVVVVRRTRA